MQTRFEGCLLANLQLPRHRDTDRDPAEVGGPRTTAGASEVLECTASRIRQQTVRQLDAGLIRVTAFCKP